MPIGLNPPNDSTSSANFAGSVSSHTRMKRCFLKLFLHAEWCKAGWGNQPLFRLYIGDLLKLLSASKISCYIAEIFIGALIYVDDIVLLAPSARARCSLLSLCDNYANEYKIVFNANKSKCLFFRAKDTAINACSPKPVFKIIGSTTEFVYQWPHLGHILIDTFYERKFGIGVMCGQINGNQFLFILF